MNKLLLLILSLILLLAGCARNRTEQAPPEDVPEQELPFTAPGWVWQIPAGGCALGITYSDSHYSAGAGDHARDYAAVSISRNHASFVVDKRMIMSLAMQDEVDWKKVDYNVVVSADLDYLRDAGRNLVLIDSFDVSGYMLGLFGQIEGTARKELVTSDPAQRPDWTAQDLYADRKTVYSVGYAHQATLMDAWSQAQEAALRRLAQYRIQNVVTQVRATEDEMQRNIAIETVTRSQNVYFDKSFIVPVRKGNTTSYRVYLQLMMADK
jgi:hypothetical protein